MGRKYTMAEIKKRLWISVENMLSEKQRADIGLRFEQDPDVWIVRIASELSEEKA